MTRPRVRHQLVMKTQWVEDCRRLSNEMDQVGHRYTSKIPRSALMTASNSGSLSLIKTHPLKFFGYVGLNFKDMKENL